MRIIKHLFVDFGSDLLFKNTLDYIDEVFGKLGITYDNMGFTLEEVGRDKTNRNIIAKYPALEKYVSTCDEVGRPENAIKSTRTDENGNHTLYVEKSEHQILREIVRKTPNPYSFFNISVFLYDIHWASKIDAISSSEPKQSVLTNPRYPFNNASDHVMLTKDFDYGKKENPVSFDIWVGNEKTGIVDISELEEKLSAALGKPLNFTQYYFYFNDDEKKHLAQQDKVFAEIYTPFIKTITETVNNAEGIQHIKEQAPWNFHTQTRVSGLSLKKALSKVLPKKQYEYKWRGGGFFDVKKKNANNHTFTLEYGLNPTWVNSYAGISVSGYNFRFQTDINHSANSKDYGFESVYPNNQDDLECHVASLAMALQKAEERLSGEMLRLYGKSLI